VIFNYTQVENIKADYQRRIDELQVERDRFAELYALEAHKKQSLLEEVSRLKGLASSPTSETADKRPIEQASSSDSAGEKR
jgi:hypothetical protein